MYKEQILVVLNKHLECVDDAYLERVAAELYIGMNNPPPPLKHIGFIWEEPVIPFNPSDASTAKMQILATKLFNEGVATNVRKVYTVEGPKAVESSTDDNIPPPPPPPPIRMVKSHTDKPSVVPGSFIEEQACRIAATLDPAVRLKCIAAIFTQDIREIQRRIAYANENGYQGKTGWGMRIVAQMLSHLHIPKDPHHE